MKPIERLSVWQLKYQFKIFVIFESIPCDIPPHDVARNVIQIKTKAIAYYLCTKTFAFQFVTIKITDTDV